jgi:hypothetical protein
LDISLSGGLTRLEWMATGTRFAMRRVVLSGYPIARLLKPGITASVRCGRKKTDLTWIKRADTGSFSKTIVEQVERGGQSHSRPALLARADEVIE